MPIKSSQQGTTTIVQVEGRLDTANYAAFEAEAAALLNNGSTAYIFDCAALSSKWRPRRLCNSENRNARPCVQQTHKRAVPAFVFNRSQARSPRGGNRSAVRGDCPLLD